MSDTRENDFSRRPVDNKSFEPQDYSFFPSEQIAEVLSDYGISPERNMLDGLFVSPDKEQAVGVRKVTEEDCRDHFIGNPLLRGVDQVTLVHQTDTAHRILTGQVTLKDAPLLRAVFSAAYKMPAVAGTTLNVMTHHGQDEHNRLITSGRIVSGRIPISDMTTWAQSPEDISYITGGELLPNSFDGQGYTQVPESVVDTTLANWQYGPSKRFLSEVFLHDEMDSASLQVTPEMTTGYQIRGNPALPEVNLVEAVALAHLLRGQFRGELDPDSQAPRLTGIKDFEFFSTAVGPLAKVYIDLSEGESPEFGGRGNVRSGSHVIARGEITGAIVDKELAFEQLEKAKRLLSLARPQFVIPQM